MAPERTGELDLRGYLRVLRRRWWIVAIVPLVAGLAAYLQASLQPEVFKSTTSVLITQTEAERLFDPARGNFGSPDRTLANQIRIIESRDVRQRAEQALGYGARVKASAAKDQDVINITARAPTATSAANIANAYAKAYIDHRVESAKSENAVAQAEVRRQIDTLQAELASVDTPTARAGGSVESSRSSLIEQLNGMRTQLGRLQASAEVARGGVQVLEPASAPASPSEPKPARSLALGVLVGAMLGLTLAFLLDYLDDTIKEQDDLTRVAPGVPVLAAIPRVPNWRDRRNTMLVTSDKPTAPAAEAYRTLRTSIQFLGLDREIKTVQITSSIAGEGKTTTVANLAVALARAGNRIAVMCCDLRYPRIHEFFGLSNRVGFTSVLLGDVPLSEALQKTRGENVLLLASGPPPPNPSELLSSSRTAEILKALQAQCDMVLIDCPPLLPVTDAAVLSNKVDATLLIATARSTTRKNLARSLEMLRQVDAPLIGCVLNGVAANDRYGYSYGYGAEVVVSDPPRTPADRYG